jgi:hypothetical protein
LISEIFKKEKINIFAYPNVVGYSEKLQKKIKNGKELPIEAIRIYVSKKVKEEELAINEIIPKKIGKYLTDVVEIGEVKALSNIDRTKRFDVIPGGVSVGEEHITAGTHTMILRDKTDGKNVTCSNWHVFGFGYVNEPGSKILQPGPYDGGNVTTDAYAILKRWVPIKESEGEWPWYKKIICFLFSWLFPNYCKEYENKVDFAIGELISNRSVTIGVLRDNGEIFKPIKIGRGKIGDKVWKVGRSSGETIGEIIDDNASLKVNYRIGAFTFKEQILTTKMMEPGDSGSPLFLIESNELIGLGFAGSDIVSVFNHWYNVEEIGKVELIF